MKYYFHYFLVTLASSLLCMIVNFGFGETVFDTSPIEVEIDIPSIVEGEITEDYLLKPEEDKAWRDLEEVKKDEECAG